MSERRAVAEAKARRCARVARRRTHHTSTSSSACVASRRTMAGLRGGREASACESCARMQVRNGTTHRLLSAARTIMRCAKSVSVCCTTARARRDAASAGVNDAAGRECPAGTAGRPRANAPSPRKDASAATAATTASRAAKADSSSCGGARGRPGKSQSQNRPVGACRRPRRAPPSWRPIRRR